MTTFYKKVGRKYVEVSQYDNDLQNAMVEGTHLVIVKPGRKSYHYNIDPNVVALIAASEHAKGAMVDALVEANKLKPQRTPLTVEQAEAWENLKKAFDDQMFSLYYDSATNVVNAGINALIEESKKYVDHPSVKNAYEQFLLVWKLTRDEPS